MRVVLLFCKHRKVCINCMYGVYNTICMYVTGVPTFHAMSRIVHIVAVRSNNRFNLQSTYSVVNTLLLRINGKLCRIKISVEYVRLARFFSPAISRRPFVEVRRQIKSS